jgi:hypothetical protein
VSQETIKGWRYCSVMPYLKIEYENEQILSKNLKRRFKINFEEGATLGDIK